MGVYRNCTHARTLIPTPAHPHATLPGRWKKIFASKTHGGKREYAVVLAIDVSESVSANSGRSIVASVAMLCAAFQEVGIESISILTFGDKVHLIKQESQPLDGITLAALLHAVQFNAPRTRDAEAVEYAIDLLQASTVRGPKSCFVFTDGYSSAGLDLARALRRADEEGVDVVGVSVGLDKSQVKGTYRRWIMAALPSALPHAFRALYEQDMDMPSQVSMASVAAECTCMV